MWAQDPDVLLLIIGFLTILNWIAWQVRKIRLVQDQAFFAMRAKTGRAISRGRQR
jgi:hypothetical protein